jgi:4-amino-4-deoxy-L-arabinose transferase-like glycosyltransferase
MTLPPVDRDEVRFAQATRQMLQSGDFVRINFQDQPRHKKPIGIYWLQAAAVSATGLTDTNHPWPYRIPSMLGAIMAVLLTYSIGKSLFDKPTGLLGAIFTASSLLLIIEAHLATADAALLATVVAAQGSLGILYVRARGGKTIGFGIAIAFWTAQGLGILIKGPVVPTVSLLTIGALFAADRRVTYLRALRPKSGILWTALIVLPWAIAITLATKGTFFSDAFRSDLLPKLISGHESHGFPPGYYLLLVTLTFWPGSLFLWPALVQAWKNRKWTAVRFCLAWLIPFWLLFELIPTKLPHYVLPTYPAISLLTASMIISVKADSRGLFERAVARAGFVLWTVISLIIASAIVALPVYFNGRFNMLTLLPAAAAVFILIFPAWMVSKGRLVEAASTAVLMAAFIINPTLHSILPGANSLWLSRSVAKAVQRHSQSIGDSKPVVASAGYHEPSLVFLLGTQTELVEVHQAALHLKKHPNALALVSKKDDLLFREALSELNGSVRQLESIRGFNYSNGKWITLNLYANEE